MAEVGVVAPWWRLQGARGRARRARRAWQQCVEGSPGQRSWGVPAVAALERGLALVFAEEAGEEEVAVVGEEEAAVEPALGEGETPPPMG